MNKHVRRFPPFCWTKGYWKFGLAKTMIGLATGWLVAKTMALFGDFWWLVSYCATIYFAWTVMPVMIMAFRPCPDCPKVKA